MQFEWLTLVKHPEPLSLPWCFLRSIQDIADNCLQKLIKKLTKQIKPLFQKKGVKRIATQRFSHYRHLAT